MGLQETIDRLRRERDVQYGEASRLIEGAEAEHRDLNTTERIRYDELRDSMDSTSEKLAGYTKMSEQRLEELETRSRLTGGSGGSWTSSGVILGRERLTYGPGSEHSMWRDLIAQRMEGNADASDRLNRHMREMAVEVPALAESGKTALPRGEYRDLTRTDTAGGNYVPPLHLIEQWAEFARPGRPVADACMKFPLPPGTDSINIPRNTTGPTAAIQTADNAGVSETDLVEALETAPVKTIAGQQDVAIQLLDQSPVAFDEVIFRELLADLAQDVDSQVLNGSGSSGQVTGMRNVSGIIAVTYTDATPTVAEAWPKITDAIQQIWSNRFRSPTAIIMHPRRWGWFLASLDGQQRPLIVPDANGPNNAFGSIIPNGNAEEVVGQMQGIPVVVDANIPTTLGTGTNEDVIVVARMADQFLWESLPRTRVLPDVLSSTLTVRLQVYGYLAFSGGRQPKSTAVISGSGWVSPSF